MRWRCTSKSTSKGASSRVGLCVMGLVDVSDYAASVAEHAAGLAERIGARR
jgi:hypothetical protein